MDAVRESSQRRKQRAQQSALISDAQQSALISDAVKGGHQRRTGFAAARTAVRADNLISMQSACNQHAISMQSVAHRVCCREDRRACRQGADDACLGHLHARRVDDQHASSMQAACTQHALSMHSACTQHAISMQSACNHRDRLLLHSLEERLVLSASHLIELVDAAAALSGRTRISMQCQLSGTLGSSG